MTYSSWRNVLWLQVAMIGLAFILALFFVPVSRTDEPVFTLNLRGRAALAQFNPTPVFKMMTYPNIILTVGAKQQVFATSVEANHLHSI